MKQRSLVTPIAMSILGPLASTKFLTTGPHRASLAEARSSSHEQELWMPVMPDTTTQKQIQSSWIASALKVHLRHRIVEVLVMPARWPSTGHPPVKLVPTAEQSRNQWWTKRPCRQPSKQSCPKTIIWMLFKDHQADVVLRPSNRCCPKTIIWTLS